MEELIKNDMESMGTCGISKGLGFRFACRLLVENGGGFPYSSHHIFQNHVAVAATL